MFHFLDVFCLGLTIKLELTILKSKNKILKFSENNKKRLLFVFIAFLRLQPAADKEYQY